jgi:hypothetical protein
MQNNFTAAESQSRTYRILPSKKPRSELRSNDGAEHYRCAIPLRSKAERLRKLAKIWYPMMKVSSTISANGFA